MHPYQSFPSKSFWKQSVASREMMSITELWAPKFQITQDDKVSTYGSCFAQHIGNALEARGYSWFRAEPAPFGMSDASQKEFGYNLFSSRTANIYTTSLLRQWTEWAADPASIPNETWQVGERHIDPFRPKIEPDGFETVKELKTVRIVTLNAFKQSVTDAKYFVFTLGLTEKWVNSKRGYEYSICPGTAGGDFNKNTHRFENMGYQEIAQNLKQAIANLRDMNPEIKIILTVSPVPLVATASDQHVLVATMFSKSLLRAVAGQFALDYDYVDYFPSYEIINSPAFKGNFFESNMRSVAPHGVEFVMNSFFAAMDNKPDTSAPRRGRLRLGSKRKAAPSSPSDDVVCEEELLEVFGKP